MVQIMKKRARAVAIWLTVMAAAVALLQALAQLAATVESLLAARH